ncbi:hypothetical protein AVEN_4393-1 [Araneus ventricosus]|uniref:Uncharacterized protein n=1 Tax=Araneus ventricosus TaxID=182803 RepID=A0A4Y2TM64_ARAVE|nr:hypothetical protein AVEN_4393-1 [Araneus ventricosus]
MSDGSFTPERIRRSGSSKGTTGLESDQKERWRSSLRTRIPRSGSNSPYGNGLPVRIGTRTRLADPDSSFGFGLGLPVRIRTPRSDTDSSFQSERQVLWVGGRRT